MVDNLLPRRLPDIDNRQPVPVPALDLAIAALTHQHRAHPRTAPLPPARPTPPTAPRACPATSERRSGSPPATTPTVPSPRPSSAPSTEDARTGHAAPPSPQPPPCNRSVHSTSRSRPSLPITGALTPGWPTTPAP